MPLFGLSRPRNLHSDCKLQRKLITSKKGDAAFRYFWTEGDPKLLAPNIACLDYSVAKAVARSLRHLFKQFRPWNMTFLSQSESWALRWPFRALLKMTVSQCLPNFLVLRAALL